MKTAAAAKTWSRRRLPRHWQDSNGPRVWQHEAVRKAIHLAMVVLPVWVWWAPSFWRSRGLLLAFIAVLTADLLRRVWKPWAQWIQHRALAYSRPQESTFWVGVHAMFLAAWLLSWSVPRDIAVGSLCYGVFGDAAAAVVGWRRPTELSHSGKSYRGSLACFVTCLGVGWLLFPGNREMILLGAGTATFLERFSGPIDDNLSIPLGSALVLSFVA